MLTMSAAPREDQEHDREPQRVRASPNPTTASPQAHDRDRDADAVPADVATSQPERSPNSSAPIGMAA